MEIFIDGERLGLFGDPSAPPDDLDLKVTFLKSPVPVTLRRSEVLVAIRFSMPAAISTVITKGVAAEHCAVGVSAADVIQSEADNELWTIRLYRFFIGVSFALGLLHFLLFVFLPERKENLQYALATWAVCALSICVEVRFVPVTVGYFQAAAIGFKLALLFLSIFFVKFYHAVLNEPARPMFIAYVITGLIMAVTVAWIPVTAIYLYATVGIIEQGRLAIMANMRNVRDAWLLGLGILSSGVGAVVQMSPAFSGAPLLVAHPYLYGYLGMLVLMSTYQARGFARTHRDLQYRLDDVRRLSEERVEQARRVKSEEMARVRLEEENKRQAVELKEASRRKEVLAQLESAHRELKETQAQLVQSEKMASLGQLVAGIAHEINTPIGAINSMHDSLSKATARLKESLQTQSPELLEGNRRVKASFKLLEDANVVIESGSQRVAKIVRRLKSFARLDEAELMRADVHEGLDDTLVLLHHELKHGIKVHRNYGSLPTFSCYPSQLNQVFLNLLVNARQSIDGAGEITIETKVVDDQAHVIIRDTGRGIAAEHLSKIFDPGFTTKGVKVGTGLGLSICYRIIKEHQGQILVQSEVGKGSTFTVVLPLDLDRRLEGET
ncbi:MAG: ATP-binding protein [Myxococcota bacterium]